MAMDNGRQEIRNFIESRLARKDDTSGCLDSDFLFSSGRLDSLDAVELIIFLEANFSFDVAAAGFDETLIDSVDEIFKLVCRPG